jgi:flagellar biosynthesis protein FliR
MTRSLPRRWRVALAVVTGVLACGLPLWPIPYSHVSMPGNPSMTTWLLAGACAGLLAGFLLRAEVLTPTLAVAAGFVLAVLARVAVETSRDPTSHNLWPFEVVIAGGIGLMAGLAGVLTARLVQRLRG